MRVRRVVRPALGSDFGQARERAYRGIAGIALEGSHHRTDIAAKV